MEHNDQREQHENSNTVELFNITGNTLIVLLELEEKIDTSPQISRLYTEYEATSSSLLPTSLSTNKSGNLLVLTKHTHQINSTSVNNIATVFHNFPSISCGYTCYNWLQLYIPLWLHFTCRLEFQSVLATCVSPVFILASNKWFGNHLVYVLASVTFQSDCRQNNSMC